MQKSLATVYLDAPPISTSIHHITDYSSYMIYTLSSLPLTEIDYSDNQCRDFAATCKVSSDYKNFEFHLRDDLYWSDGHKIQPIDYYRMFNLILNDKNNRYRSMLSDLIGYESENIKGIEYTNESILFKLKKSNYFFPMFLSFPSFSPLHSTQLRNLSGGAYYIIESNSEFTQLKKNDHFKIKLEIQSINNILFKYKVNKDDPFALKAFNQGEIDVTSDTAFPYDQYTLYMNKKNCMHKLDIGIICMLTENKNASRHITKAMIHGINRKEIIAHFNNVPSINCGYHYIFNKNSENIDTLYDKEEAIKYIYNKYYHDEITIAYEDFYPNREILSVIESQLNSIGLHFKLIIENYGMRNIVSNYRLSFRKSPIPDPIIFYKNEVKRFSKNSNEQLMFIDLLSQYQMTSDLAIRNKMAIQMDNILINEGKFIPLIKIPGIYLKNPSIKNNKLFSPGQLWYI